MTRLLDWFRRQSPPVIIALTIGIGGIVVFGSLLLLTVLHLNLSSDGPREPRADVRVDDCVATSYDSPKALLHVHNSTARQVDYFITVVFEQNGVQKGSGTAVVVDLNAGQDADTDAVGFGADASSGSGWRCRVSSVRRI